MKDLENGRHVRDLSKPPLSSVQTEYEAKYQQKGHQGNESFSTVKGKQEIVHNNCSDNWNEFAEKCATLIKDLVASLANAISSNPGDTTNLQLQIKNSFRHFDSTNNCSCFRTANTTLSDLSLNLPSLFNKSTPTLTITTTNPNHSTEILKYPLLSDEKKIPENEFQDDTTTPMQIVPKTLYNQHNVGSSFEQIENPITGQHLGDSQVTTHGSNNAISQSGNLLPPPLSESGGLHTLERPDFGSIKGAGSHISNQDSSVAIPVSPNHDIEKNTENLGLLPAGVPPLAKTFGGDNTEEPGLNVPQPVLPALMSKQIENTATSDTPVLVTNDSFNNDGNSNFNGNTLTNNNQEPNLPINSESGYSHSEPNSVGISSQQNEEVATRTPKVKQVPVIKLPPLKHPSEFIPPISLSKQQSIQSSEMLSPSLVSELPLKESFPEIQQPEAQPLPPTKNNEMNSFTPKNHPEQHFVTDCPQENAFNNKPDPSFEQFPTENLVYKPPSIDQSSPSTVTDCPNEQSNVQIQDSEQVQSGENQHSNTFVHSNAPTFSPESTLNSPLNNIPGGVQGALPPNNVQQALNPSTPMQSFVDDSQNAQPAIVPGSTPENNLPPNVLPMNPTILPQGNAVADIQQMNQPMKSSQMNEMQNNLPMSHNEPNGPPQTLEGYLPLPAKPELPPIQSVDPVNKPPTTSSYYSTEPFTFPPISDSSSEEMTGSAESVENKPAGISQTIPQSTKPLEIIAAQPDSHGEGLLSLNVPPVKPLINTSPLQENYGAENFPNDEKNSVLLPPNNVAQLPPVNLPPSTVSTNNVPPSENHFAGVANEEVKSSEPLNPITNEMPLITVPQIQPPANPSILPESQLPGSSNVPFVPNQMATQSPTSGKSSSGELLPHLKSDSTQISDFSSSPPVTSLPPIPFLSKPPLNEPSSVNNNLPNTSPENNLPVSPSVGLMQPTNTVVPQPNLAISDSQVKTPLMNPVIVPNVKPPANSLSIGNEGVSTLPVQSQDAVQPFPNQTPFMSPTLAPPLNSLTQNVGAQATSQGVESQLPINEGIESQLPTNQGIASQLPTNQGIASQLPINQGVAGQLPTNQGVTSQLPVNQGIASQLPTNQGVAGQLPTSQGIGTPLPANPVEIQNQQQPSLPPPPTYVPVKTVEPDSSLTDSWPEDKDELGISQSQKATTFQTTSVEPTPAQSSVLLPPSHHSSTSSYPKSVFLPVNQGTSEQSTTESSISKNNRDNHHRKHHDADEEDEDDYDDCCTCESCSDDESSNFSPRQFRTSACKDLEQAKRELKAIFDKIKKKLKCGKKAPKTISTSAAPFTTV